MDPITLLVLGVAGLIALLLLVFILQRFVFLYMRVPPNKVMVLYGRGKTVFREDGTLEQSGMRMVTGGGTFVWRLIEDFQFLDLTVMTIVKTGDEVYTVDGVPIKLDWVAQVHVRSDGKALITAARAFLGMPRDQVINVVTQTLSANFRAIVGRLSVEDVHRDRDAFVRSVQELAADDMLAMGIQVISMGIEEITDDQGYFEAMAKPRIAAIKRDATIAEAEAEREARIKAAQARQQAEQVELESARSILEQRQALELRDVEKKKTVALAQTKADEDVLRQRALLVQQQQEVDVLTPARAKREATEIEAESESRKIKITTQARTEATVIEAESESRKVKIATQARAEATRQEAAAQAEATRLAAAAQAEALEAQGKAEAEKLRSLRAAEADGSRATLLAQAEGTRATLLAEAEGKERLAAASAAQGEINLRQAIAQLLIDAEVQKARAIAEAVKGVGGNVRIVQFAGGNGDGVGGGSALANLLREVPELATVINAKTEALSGQNIEQVLQRITRLFAAGTPEPPAVEAPASAKD
jgi:flotillin